MVLGILALLIGIVGASLLQHLPDYRLNEAVSTLITNMQKAKIEAVERSSNIVIKFYPGSYSPAGEVGWYKIFEDNGAGSGTANNFICDGSEYILVHNCSMPKNVSLYEAKFGTEHYTGFNFMGMTLENRIGRIKLRNNQSMYYKLTLSMPGNINTRKSDDGSDWVLQ